MSRLGRQQMLMPSVLDRLIDPESGGTAARRGYSVEQAVDAVRRDLEDLLNTRRTSSKDVEDYPEVANSIVAYGLPDLASFDAITPQQREAIGRVIEAVITRFEPRLRDVRATLVDPGDAVKRSVRFHVDARLAMDPAPEVAFETILELTTGHAAVRPGEAKP
jgi:type VI secretion system protein ImpF